jgi:hypothetical protein
MATVSNHAITTFNGTSASITITCSGLNGQLLLWKMAVPSNMSASSLEPNSTVTDNLGSQYKRIARSYNLAAGYGLTNSIFGAWMTYGGLTGNVGGAPITVTVNFAFNEPLQGVLAAMYIVPSALGDQIAPDQLSFGIEQGTSNNPTLTIRTTNTNEFVVGGIAYIANVKTVPTSVGLTNVPFGMTLLDNAINTFNGTNAPLSTGTFILGLITYQAIVGSSITTVSVAFNSVFYNSISWLMESTGLLDGTNVPVQLGPQFGVSAAVLTNSNGSPSAAITQATGGGGVFAGTLIPTTPLLSPNVPTVIGLPLGV